MDDGVHLNTGAMGVLMDQVITKTEENLAARKKGPTERAGPAVKKARVASDGGYRGAGRGGRGGQGGLVGGCCKADLLDLLGKGSEPYPLSFLTSTGLSNSSGPQ